MTTTNHFKNEQIRRMTELGRLSRQRYLDAGGDPRLSVGSLNNNDYLTDTEKQEFLELFRQVVTDRDIANYLKEHGTWSDRLAAMKKK